MKTVSAGSVSFGGRSFGLIAGPCVIEGRDHALKMSTAIQIIAEKVGIPVVYKSSFDKANRTSISTFRGPGLEDGLAILSDVKAETGLPILTDIHEVSQADAVAEAVDVVQIPAFLCRQTDLLIAAAKTGKTVNVKKGQFLAPWDMKNVVDKLSKSGCENILLTDRGTQFGYNNLVADMRAIPIMQEHGYPVVFDATHSAQLPGGTGTQTAGMRDMIPTLANSAVAAGCNGIFMEVHDDVDSAKSDAATQWPLNKLESLLIKINAIREALK
ncbi:MAG: 3-deoxy-8-phosphooctulonate synthase [Candidatus Neomarinimicrobiota bacterium]|jgi:2-dehydro-3-deoxyphosphooctonate aldolase (KDO 8-P synthase)|nr:3-deoxy-8-phosphooctulonate synthase [Candidatus Neomarinimicrobiota bacterium]|tara:strand:- start:955 stop:1767 length:813 start_codon:yes stop_codon:yes gene_type:complete